MKDELPGISATQPHESEETGHELLTPILLKTSDSLQWPENQSCFYVLAREGLYLIRQNGFFRSCVKVKDGPSELASQAPFYEPLFPKIPKEVIEQAVGFFSEIADLHNSEAAALLVWDPDEQQVRLVVPRQTATVSRSTANYSYPIGVHYEPPIDLPESWVVFGDIHCHVSGAAYASYTDVQDELHSTGLHIVIGRIHDEPPEVHVEAVVDTQRFVIPSERVIEGYHQRCADVPRQWIERVEVEVETYKWSTYPSSYTAN
jgi:PRTRC genetic system protein A